MDDLSTAIDSLPFTAYGLAILHGEHFVDVWIQGIICIVPHPSGSAFYNLVWVPSKADSTSQEDASTHAFPKILPGSLPPVGWLRWGWAFACIFQVVVLVQWVVSLINLCWHYVVCSMRHVAWLKRQEIKQIKKNYIEIRWWVSVYPDRCKILTL
jgi:hypothetical protein